MSTVSTEISKYIGSATKLADIWGKLIFNVKDTQFAGGAKGDGVADDTAAIQAAIDASGALTNPPIVSFPPGTYLISSTIIIRKPIILNGSGSSSEENFATFTPNSVLKWIGAAGGKMMWINDSQLVTIGGIGIHQLCLDANSIAGNALHMQGISNCSFSDLYVAHYTSIGLRISCTTNGTFSFNRFYNLNIGSISPSTQAVVMEDNLNYNPCHNTFIGIRITWDGPKTGFVVTGDNNTFYDIYCSRRPTGTGYGVTVGTGVNSANGDNIFYHLQSSAGGLRCQGSSGNTVFSYTRGNGEPAPIVDPGSFLANFSYDTVYMHGNATIDGSLLSKDVISAANGFMTSAFIPNAINPIWRFGNALTSGMSFYHGTNIPAGDSIGFHFGVLASPTAIVKNDGSIGIGTLNPKSKLHVVGLPVFANNAAAITGGLTIGAFYRTGADPDPVCVVH